MTLTVNGEPQTVEDGATIADLVEALKLPNKGIAVAVGETIVPMSLWSSTSLNSDEQVEILTAAQGG